MKKKKERAVIYFSLFLLFMLVCTIVSRGIYAYQMPQVTLGEAESHTLKHELEAYGSVLTKEELPVVTEAGLLVKRVCVVEGQKVNAGDLLFEIETEDLASALRQSQAKLTALKTGLAEQKSAEGLAALRASEDFSEAAARTANEVGMAEQEYRAAQAAADGFPSEKEYKDAAYKKDKEYKKLQKSGDKKAFSDYKKSLDASLSEAYRQEKEAAVLAAQEKKKALDAANANRSDALKQAGRALEDAKKGNGADAGSRMEQENELTLATESRDRLLHLQEAEGKVFCGVEGYVSRIFIHAGERTGDTSALVIADAAGEKLFQAVLPAEEKAFVGPGSKMNLSFRNGAKQLYSVEIEAVGELEDGSCQVTGKVDDPNLAIGESGKMELSADTGRYACCVPLDALHTDGETEYILLAEEEQTILGTELVARRRKVSVTDRDKEYAALEDGAVVEGEQVVVSSNKEIRDGQRVRLSEQE